MSQSELMEVAALVGQMKKKQSVRRYTALVDQLCSTMKRLGYLSAKEARQAIAARFRVGPTAAHRKMSGPQWKRFCQDRIRINRRLVFCRLSEQVRTTSP